MRTCKWATVYIRAYASNQLRPKSISKLPAFREVERCDYYTIAFLIIPHFRPHRRTLRRLPLRDRLDPFPNPVLPIPPTHRIVLVREGFPDLQFRPSAHSFSPLLSREKMKEKKEGEAPRKRNEKQQEKQRRTSTAFNTPSLSPSFSYTSAKNSSAAGHGSCAPGEGRGFSGSIISSSSSPAASLDPGLSPTSVC